jgi:hypothetical protein
MKKCKMCNMELNYDDFYRWNKKTGGKCFSSYCKRCTRKLHKKDRDIKEYTRKRRYRQLGLTVERYDEMLTEQNNVCKLCKKPPKTMRLAVDHCHETGRIRGLLCTSCNVQIGIIEKNQRRMKEILEYTK